MKDDQAIRLVAAVLVTIAYGLRLYLHGSGPVQVLGYSPNLFVVYVLIVLTLAIPETMDQLPFGPSRK